MLVCTSSQVRSGRLLQRQQKSPLALPLGKSSINNRLVQTHCYHRSMCTGCSRSRQASLCNPVLRRMLVVQRAQFNCGLYQAWGFRKVLVWPWWTVDQLCLQIFTICIVMLWRTPYDNNIIPPIIYLIFTKVWTQNQFYFILFLFILHHDIFIFIYQQDCCNIY